ncbi:replication factor C small subunit [Candidatus Woesearchaeota archaeon]|nr:replication factor C small subunit [Candidatus Woesearchaeota archaeon]
MESTIWTEKYRPNTFDEVRGQKEIVEKIRAFVASGSMPHLLFSGPAGVGKTTLSLVIAKQLFGENWRQNTLELNASDERGIDVVRVKVKDFARTKAIGDVPFKLIYLDESDALTKEAQQALRRTMENYTKTCRFILSCNYSSKIIDPIQSRCAVFRFKPLSREDIDLFVRERLLQKEFECSGPDQNAVYQQVIDALYEVSQGDMRRVMNILQSCAVLKKYITADDIYSMASVAKPKEVEDVLELAAKGNFVESRKKLLDLMLQYGLAGLDVIKQIQQGIWHLPLDDRQKVALIDKCGEVEFRMVEGSDEYLQLESFLAFVAMVGVK